MKLFRALSQKGTPIITVCVSGSALALGEVEEKSSAVLQAWYPGEQGGHAVYDVLSGAVNPSGRLPVTFYRSDNDLPDIADYSMTNRTYRYFQGDPLYPFGFGLSYSRFCYENLAGEVAKDEILLHVEVENTSDIDGSEVIQLYARSMEEDDEIPNAKLVGFLRVDIPARKRFRKTIAVEKEVLMVVDDQGKRRLPKGRVRFYAGGHQPDALSCRLAGTSCIYTEFSLS